MGDTSDIKKGGVIRHNNDLYLISDFQFVNPGKGSAFTKTKIKSLSNGKSIEITYKSSETVDMVQVDYVNMQYLYKTPNAYSFMNQKSFETVDIDATVIGDDGKFLKEAVEVVVAMHEGRAVSMQLPKKIQYKVVEAPPAVKGDSAGGNVTKEIVLDNGLHVQAPIFIKEGEEIVLNTETGDYSARASSEK